MYSLRARLLLAASIVLAAFLGLTGLVLDRAFRDSAETALRERLQAQMYALLAVADIDSSGTLGVPNPLADPRFSTPGSGLYAEISRSNGKTLWRSPSSLGVQIDYDASPGVGERWFARHNTQTGIAVHALSFGIGWEDARGQAKRYSFRVAETLDGLNAQIGHFRHSLWVWLLAAALVLLAVQGTILRWGLSPLRRVAHDLAAMEAGEAQTLRGNYPKELRGLTDNINALIQSAQAHLVRYRDSLGNLAHSLKTPLAVLHSAVQSPQTTQEWRLVAQDQVERMRRIIDYQLQRAAASGGSPLMAPVSVAAELSKLMTALGKVYADKSVGCVLDVGDEVVFYGDGGDLMEMAGNIMENAFKCCRSKVRVQAASLKPTAKGFELVVEDDGPGIPAALREQVLQRGQRADTTNAGQGIGLSMVVEIVHAYGGSLAIDDSDLGGARIKVRVQRR